MFRFRTKILECVPGRRGQSTVELALLLPTIVLMLSFIIYAYKVNHTISQQTHDNYANKISKFHLEGMIFDPVKGIFVPEGQYSELITPDALIDPGKLVGELALQMIAQLGLNKLFSALNIDTTTYAGAFAQGFTSSLASAAISTGVQTGSLHDMNAQDLENATWAGGAAAFSSQDATEDFQGGEGVTAGTETGLQEFLGSGAQAGLIGFFNSHGDLKVAGASAVGGALNSDTSNEWVDVGADGTDDSAGAEILRGATKGAVQSSASGLIGGNLDGKTVVVGAATGAVQTDAFAETLPLTGDDPKNSAMYGAFNGAFSSTVSGGSGTDIIYSAAGGALSSKQTAGALGGDRSFTYNAASIAGNAGLQYASGSSLQAVGIGALTSSASSGIRYGVKSVSGSLSKSFDGYGSNKSGSSSESSGQRTSSNDPMTTQDAQLVLNDQGTADNLAEDEIFTEDIDGILDGTVAGVQNGETLASLEPEEVPSP